MRGGILAIAVVGPVALAAAQADPSAALADVLQRAGERVERYFARAQSIVCLEVVRLQPLTSGWGSEGFGRTVESELRLSWAPGADGVLPTEAQAVRQVVRVNGHKPRAKDHDNCTTPEQEDEEPQPLSLLLPARQADFHFKLAGRATVDRRGAIMVDYRRITNVIVETRMVEGRDDCVSFDLEGGTQGRIWIDAQTFDVLRLDQRLIGMVEIPLPRELTRRSSAPATWTMERWDSSIRYKPVSFTNPDETLILPATTSELRITRGAGTPRLRTTTDYVNYQRFLTSGRVVGVPQMESHR